ncbi:MAG: glycosyltransferase family 4 protein [Verrucomicrobiae bacterium]|nr:glycosyltransferase family 4 protein [Verrucomicrobiae bacterium]
MKALLVASEFPPGPGGIGTHAWQLARHLPRWGWEVTVLAAQDYVSDAEAVAFGHGQPFRLVRLPRASHPAVTGWRRWRHVGRMLGETRPDVVLATGMKSVWIAAATAPKTLPWVAIGHATEFRVRGRVGSSLTRWAFQKASTVVCVSRFTRGLMRSAGIRPRAEEVIPNGADPGAFEPMPEAERQAFRERKGVTGARILLTVGNVTDRKGQEVVIRALPAIVRRHPEVVYVMVGMPTRRDAFLTVARELGVEGHVRFEGIADAADLRAWYQVCEVFVVTSRTTASGDSEGFGIVAVEAALSGRPSVVSEGSGLVEAILPGETGLTAPENDPPATASVILRLLDDAVLRERMGMRARERALNEQTWEQCVQRFDQVLKPLVESPLGVEPAPGAHPVAGIR